MKKHVILSLFLLTARSALGASGYALVWGGNCNWNGADFKTPMAVGAKSLSDRGWDVTLGFDKNVDEIKSSLSPGYRGAVQDGSKKTLFNFLDQVQAKAKKGEEVLIVVNTHGGEETSDHPHSWSLPDCSGLSVNDKDLQEKLAQLQKKGIRIAISDESCFSGNSISHLQNFGCVMSDQGDAESVGSTFLDAINGEGTRRPSSLPLTDVFRSMLGRKGSLLSPDEQGFLNYEQSAVTEPQMSGFAKSVEISNSDAQMVQAQTDFYQSTSFNQRSAANVCGADEVLNAFDIFEKGLSSQVEADSNVLTKTLIQAIQKDEQNLKGLLQTQDQILKDANAALSVQATVPLSPVVIDLKAVDPAFVGVLEQFSDPRVSFNWTTPASANSSGISVNSNMIKDGKFIIPWQMGKTDPEEMASMLLSALERTPRGKDLKDISNLDQKIRGMAASGELVSQAELPSDQQATLDGSKKAIFHDLAKLAALQREITEDEAALDLDVRAVRTVELNQITSKSSKLPREDRKRFENCANFKL